MHKTFVLFILVPLHFAFLSTELGDTLMNLPEIGIRGYFTTMKLYGFNTNRLSKHILRSFHKLKMYIMGFIVKNISVVLYICVFLFWGLVVISRFRFNGTVFGFDYGLYQPDGAHYTFRTLTFLGHENKSAAQQVAQWYELHGINHNIFNYKRLVPETNPVWNLSAPRVVYPILSMPFVYVFGIPGMLAVPALSLLVLCLVVMKLSFQIDRKFIGLIVVAALLCSTSISRWMVSNITDGLLVMFCSLFLLALKLESRIWSWHLTSFIIISSSLTRFCLPIWICIGVYLLKTAEIKKAISVFVFSIIGVVPVLLYSPMDGVTAVSSDSNFLESLLAFPYNSLKVIFFEFGQLFVLDRVLFILLVAGFVYSFKSPNSEEVSLFCAVLLGCVAIGSINGVIGVNFRYYLPVLPFLANVLVHADWKIRLDSGSTT